MTTMPRTVSPARTTFPTAWRARSSTSRSSAASSARSSSGWNTGRKCERSGVGTGDCDAIALTVHCESFLKAGFQQGELADDSLHRRRRLSRQHAAAGCRVRQRQLQGQSKGRMDERGGRQGQAGGAGLQDRQVQGRRELLRDLRQQQGRQEGRDLLRHQDTRGREGRSQRLTLKAWDLLVRLLHWALAALIVFDLVYDDGCYTHRLVGYGA